MTKQFEILRKTRQFLLNHVSELTTSQLNEVPEGFNNNIIWNLAHMAASLQNVCYLRNELPIKMDEALFQAYKPGTKPADLVDGNKVEQIKFLLLESVDTLREDYENKLFQNFKPWKNRYGVSHQTMEDSINFLVFHDGLHVGYIMALKHAIQTESRSKADQIRKAYTLFNERNVDDLLTMMTPDVEWPNGWEGGWVQGRDAVREYWTRQWEVINPQVVPVHFNESDDETLEVAVAQTVLDLEGKILFNGKVKHVYRFDGELIKRMDIRQS
jgi:hypothetical protein